VSISRSKNAVISMKYEPFELERWLASKKGQFNLSGLGPPPVRLSELMDPKELDDELLYGDTRGSEELRKLIASNYGGLSPENVLITTGTAEANYLTLTALLDHDDEAILIVPTYMQAYGLARGLGAQVKLIQMNEEDNNSIPLEQLKSAISAKTKMIFYTNPNNPTGSTTNEATVRAICEIASEHAAYVVCDEVLRGLEMDGGLTLSPASIYENGVSTASLSKLGIRGIRIGWLSSPDSRFMMETWNLKDYTTLSHSGLSERVATAAMRPDKLKWLREKAKESFRDGRVLLMKWIRDNSQLLSCLTPAAGGSAFPKYHMDMDSISFGERLLKEEDVLVAPGSYFGYDNHFRVKFVADNREKLLEGFSRISDFLQRHTDNS